MRPGSALPQAMVTRVAVAAMPRAMPIPWTTPSAIFSARVANSTMKFLSPVSLLPSTAARHPPRRRLDHAGRIRARSSRKLIRIAATHNQALARRAGQVGALDRVSGLCGLRCHRGNEVIEAAALDQDVSAGEAFGAVGIAGNKRVDDPGMLGE